MEHEVYIRSRYSTPPGLVDGIEQFVEAMRQQQRAPLTLRNYRQDLLHFAVWHQGSLDMLTTERLQAYLAALLPLGLGTLRRKRTSLRSFLRWAEEASYCPVLLVANLPLLGT